MNDLVECVAVKVRRENKMDLGFVKIPLIAEN